jgi:hypothetical protein|nr:MAG TPA: hypothetical protein [Caudoviricetes sp.]
MYFDLNAYLALKTECKSCIGKVRRRIAEIFGNLNYLDCIAIILDFEIAHLKKKYRNTVVTKDLINADLSDIVFEYFLNEVNESPLTVEEMYDGYIMLLALYDIVFFDGRIFKDLDYLTECVDYKKEEAGYYDRLEDFRRDLEFITSDDMKNIAEESNVRELINLYIRDLYERSSPSETFIKKDGATEYRFSLECRIIGVEEQEEEIYNIIEEWLIF